MTRVEILRKGDEFFSVHESEMNNLERVTVYAKDKHQAKKIREAIEDKGHGLGQIFRVRIKKKRNRF